MVVIIFMDVDEILRVFEFDFLVSILELKCIVKKVEEDLEKCIVFKISVILDIDSYFEENRRFVLEMIKFLLLIFELLIEDELGKKVVVENIENIKILIVDVGFVIL